MKSTGIKVHLWAERVRAGRRAFWFTVKARNGRILADGHGYNSRANAIQTIAFLLCGRLMNGERIRSAGWSPSALRKHGIKVRGNVTNQFQSPTHGWVNLVDHT